MDFVENEVGGLTVGTSNGESLSAFPLRVASR